MSTANIQDLIEQVTESAHRDEAAAREAATRAVQAARKRLDEAGEDPAQVERSTTLLVGALLTAARAAMIADELPEARSFANQGLHLCGESDSPHSTIRRAGFLRVLGALHSDEGEHAEAIACLSHALSLAKAGEDTSAVLRTHLSLGVAESRLGDDQTALEHYEAALGLFGADTRDRPYVQGNAALSLRRLGRLEDSLTLSDQARAAYADRGDAIALANVIMERGVAFHHLGRWAEAKAAFETALGHLAGRHPPLIAAARLYQAELLLDPRCPWHDPEEALAQLRAASRALGQSGYEQEQMDIEAAFSRAYEELGQPALALAHHRRYHVLIVARHARTRDRTLAEARAGLGVEAARTGAQAARAAQLALMQANEAAANALHDKQALMEMMRHDLRGMLMSMLYLAPALEADLRPAGQASLSRLNHLAERMLGIVDQVEALEGADAASLDLESLDLATVVGEVIGAHAPAGLAKAIVLSTSIEGEARVVADCTSLSRCLSNLVSNAIKFSDANTRVEVDVEATVHQLTVVVADRGPGLSPDDQARAFRPFQRLSARPTAGEPSSGLGLSIVDRLVRAQGGRAWCAPRAGGGAVFGFTLPCLPVSEPSRH